MMRLRPLRMGVRPACVGPAAVVVIALSTTLVGCSLLRSSSTPTVVLGVERGPSTLEARPILPTSAASPTVITPGSALVHASPSTPEQGLLTLDVPEPGQKVYSPVYVRGSGTVPFERVLESDVIDVDGDILGSGLILFDPATPFGEKAAYEGVLYFRQPEQQQLGSVRVVLRSPRDDSIVDYAQVLVVLLPAGVGSSEIKIDVPVAGAVIRNPVHVEGTARAPQNQVTVRLRSGPAILAADTVALTGEIGATGRFSVDLGYAPLPASTSRRPGYPAPSENAPGHIEVFFRSPKDGRIDEIASVPVVIPGAVAGNP
ncbi:MAG: hypothetical protein D6791_02105 [Chloroflexi bacterium]|nr:MAG: hypothetical protein D6791_02105 [Chloroflexota bacterium]